MNKWDRLKKINDDAYIKNLDAIDSQNSLLNHAVNYSIRASVIAENAQLLIDKIDNDFQKATKLNKIDISFLFLATALQCARQYIFSNEKFRLSHNQGDKLMDSALFLAPPDWKEILTQPVPYDAFEKGQFIHMNDLGGKTHRYRTLGHDPILGWVFGTANIMTNSLTKTNFETYVVKGKKIIRHYPMGVNGMFNNAISYAVDDLALFPISILRQAIHFGSDYFTKQGLPVPIIATVNNDLAKEMVSKWHIDMWSITRGVSVAVVINYIIECMHFLFYDEKIYKSLDLYKVKTNKIIDISNLLASSSNVIYVAISKDLTKLDVGGILVTLYRLLKDSKFKYEIEKEFLENNWEKLVIGDMNDE